MIWILTASAVLLVFVLFSMRTGNPVYDLVRLPLHLLAIYRSHRGRQKPLRISYGKHKAQYVLYIAPESSLPGQPAVFFIHGGGWQFGNPHMFMVHAEALAGRGYPVYLLCHRKIPLFRSEQLRYDVENGYRYCLEHLAESGHPDRKVLIGGMSSGGNLGALLFLDKKRLKELNIHPDRMIGAFFMGAPLDLDQMRPSPPLLLFAGPRGSTSYRMSNPVNYLEPSDQRPVLVIHGGRDGIVEPEASTCFFRQRLQLAPKHTRLLLLPEGIHYDPVNWALYDGFLRNYLFDWLESCWKK